VGDQLCRGRADTTTTVRLEALGLDLQSIGRAGKALQLQVEAGLTLVIGAGGLESLVEALLGSLGVVELKARVGVECGEAWRQGHARRDTPVGGGGAKQVLQADAGAEVIG